MHTLVALWKKLIPQSHSFHLRGVGEWVTGGGWLAPQCLCAAIMATELPDYGHAPRQCRRHRCVLLGELVILSVN